VIIDAFNWPVLQAYFERLASRCGGQDGRAIVMKLSRYGQWEFEDYTPGPELGPYRLTRRIARGSRGSPVRRSPVPRIADRTLKGTCSRTQAAMA
jgi:hypothetical protein